MAAGIRFLFWAGGITIVQFFLPIAGGHFGILVPESPAVRRGEPVTVQYCTGHPFECQLVDTLAPEKAAVMLPDGKGRAEVKPQSAQGDGAEGGKVVVQKLTFTPAERGDHWVAVTSPLQFDDHAGGFVQDDLKTLVRVQVQQGWDNATGQEIELVPLTRPYGLKPGHAFVVQARLRGKPLADAEVEVEKYNPKPPASIPEDEALVTQVVRTDVNGYAVCTLDEAGWWGLMVTTHDGTRDKDGKAWPVVRRGILWVRVEATESAKVGK